MTRLSPRNQNLVHAEFNGVHYLGTQRPIFIADLLLVDALSGARVGAIFEIEPIYARYNAQREAGRKAIQLRVAGATGQLRGIYTGVGPFAGAPYDWNSAAWRLGFPTLFPPMRLPFATPGLNVAPTELVAVSPDPGAIIFWLEPLIPVYGPAWDAWKATVPNKKLARPHGWSFGQPLTPRLPSVTQPAPTPPPPPPSPPIRVVPDFPFVRPNIVIPALPNTGGGGGACTPPGFPSGGGGGLLTP